MSMILSWVLFPLVLAAVGLGWGALVEWVAGERELGALTIPIGLAAAIVVAAIFTAFSFSAQAAAPVVAAGAIAGLLRAFRRTAIPTAAIVAAVGVLLVYGAPVILSGQDTFLGYVRLDDTATWLGFIDQFFQHGRSLSSLDPSSTYYVLLNANLGAGAYPSGAFMLPGIGHWITGIDAAWIFQPDLAVCAAALSLCCFELLAPVLESAWLRGFVAFIAAQSALLFGYAAWGGIKELTAAFLLALVVAAGSRLLDPARRGATVLSAARASVPAAVAAAAVIDTLGPAAAVYVGPLALALALIIALRGRSALRRLAGHVTAIPLTAALMLPAWLTLSAYIPVGSSYTSSAAVTSTAYGNLIPGQPLRAIQLAGIWIDGDFRSFPNPPPSFINHLLIWIVLVAAVFALSWTIHKRSATIALYVAVALISISVLSLLGAVPWVMGKSLAFSSPAMLLAGLTGGAILFAHRSRVAAAIGVLVLGAIAGGVLWSNFEQYHNVTLAPRDRLSELQKIGTLVAGHGPTFINEYEIYADRHFLRAGSPIEPAEYRPIDLPTLGNAVLTDSAWANIDAFGLSTLAPYRSLVLRAGPTESRPPTIYGERPVWQGTYYQLWEQPAHPTERVIVHVPLGDTANDAYCGNASNVASSPGLCPIAPASVPSCQQVHALAASAAAHDGELLAYERTNPFVVRASSTSYVTSEWYGQAPDLAPAVAGASATWHLTLAHAISGYQLWLGGSFMRGFTVSVDGRAIGDAFDQLNPVGAYDPVGDPLSLAAGAHTITVTDRGETLAPGSAVAEPLVYDEISAIALSPPTSQARYVTVEPAQASALCGRSLDWIEVVAPE
jgi:hypothetical protein